MSENKEFDEVMQEITSGLTGDRKADLKYLMEAGDKYKNHKYAQEILREIGRMMYELIPDDMKEEFTKTIQEEADKYDRPMEEAKECIRNNDFDKALDILGKAVAEIEEHPMYQNDSVTEYYYFEEPMQELLYRRINNPRKEIKRAGLDYMSMYYLYGSVLVELGCIEDAREALGKARRWNPASTAAAFEYAETYKMVGDLDNFVKVTKEIYPYIYRKTDFARFFRNLGYYYIEKENYEIATCCFLFSSTYEKHPMVENELGYIEDKTGSVPDLGLDEVAQLFSQNDIPLTISDEVLKVAYSFGKHFYDENAWGEVAYFWGIFQEFMYEKEIEDGLAKAAEELEKQGL